MKDFLSEYGFAILAAIVVILLIAMCTPVGNLIKNQVLGVVDSFAGKTEAKLAAIDDDGAAKVTLRQDSTAVKFLIASASSTDKFKVEYRIKDQHGNWDRWEAATAADVAREAETAIAFASGYAPEDGNQVQVRITDTGKNDKIYFESNIVTYAK